MKRQEIKFSFIALHEAQCPSSLSLCSAGVEAGYAVEHPTTTGICIFEAIFTYFVGDRFVRLSHFRVLVWKKQLKYFIPHLIK